MLPTLDRPIRAKRPSWAMPDRDTETAQEVHREKERRIGHYMRLAAAGKPLFDAPGIPTASA